MREAKERQAEQATAEAERTYNQADSGQQRVKQQLATRWEEALRRLEDLRAEHRQHPVVQPMNMSEPDRVELRHLLADLPALWRHPRVTPILRKAVARAVIASIHVTPESEALKVEIEWVGGERTSFTFLTSQGVRALVEREVCNGRTAAEIVQLLANRGAIQRAGTQVGKPYTTTSVKALIHRFGWERSVRREAYAYIRDRYLDRVPMRQIADELNARKIYHPRGGRWTEHRVQGTVYRLRQRSAGHEPLPSIRRIDAPVTQLHNAGLSPKEIAMQLRRDGALTRQRRPVTPERVRALLRPRASRRQGKFSERDL